MKFPKSIKVNPLFAIFLTLLISIVFGLGYISGKNYQDNEYTLKSHEEIVQNDDKAIKNDYVSNSTIEPSPVITSDNTSSQNIPSAWSRANVLGFTLCLPPKWEADQWGNVYFNRDPSYRPSVTFIDDIPYDGGSRREAYYKFWEKDYPEIRQTITAEEVAVGSSTILKFSGPEGERVAWLAKGKLWQGDISGWASINTSKTAYLNDYYRMISCTF